MENSWALCKIVKAEMESGVRDDPSGSLEGQKQVVVSFPCMEQKTQRTHAHVNRDLS